MKDKRSIFEICVYVIFPILSTLIISFLTNNIRKLLNNLEIKDYKSKFFSFCSIGPKQFNQMDFFAVLFWFLVTLRQSELEQFWKTVLENCLSKKTLITGSA